MGWPIRVRSLELIRYEFVLFDCPSIVMLRLVSDSVMFQAVLGGRKKHGRLRAPVFLLVK